MENRKNFHNTHFNDNQIYMLVSLKNNIRQALVVDL